MQNMISSRACFGNTAPIALNRFSISSRGQVFHIFRFLDNNTMHFEKDFSDIILPMFMS